MIPAPFKFLKVFDYDYAYLDSGPPASSNYTTWVIFHGIGFNGAVFEKCLVHAHKRNLRIVSVNRRGYAPSSGFQADELEGIGRGKKYEDAEPFLRGQGTEIATFLVNFAIEQHIPLADLGSATGGIVLIGWSLAAIHVHAFLAYVDELPEDSRFTLQKYLHTILCHDVIAPALGIPQSDRHDITLWLEPDDRKRFDAFVNIVTAHYIHKSITSENIDDLKFNTSSDLPRSLAELSYEERAKYTDLHPFGFAGCDGKLLFCDVSTFMLLPRRGLFDKARAEMFPNVRVRYMCSGTSPAVMVWTLWVLRKYVENPETHYGSGAEIARDIKFLIQEGGNHFVFWDDPEKAIEHYSASVNM